MKAAARYTECKSLDTKIGEKRYFESRQDKPRPKDDLEERFPSETGMLFGCS
jgi:hypothetical protein